MGHSPLLPLTLRPSKKKNDTRPGRQFTAACLGWVTCPYLAESRDTPVYLALAGPRTTLKPFVANFLHGDATAILGDRYGATHLTCGKSAGLRHKWNSFADGVLIVAWHPAFELNPAPSPDASFGVEEPIHFAHMPRRAWLAEQAEQFDAFDDPIEAARAAHFCVYLKRRTRLPISNEPAFHVHLFRRVHASWRSRDITKTGFGAFEDPTLYAVAPDDFETWLREETRSFFGGNATKNLPTRKAA